MRNGSQIGAPFLVELILTPMGHFWLFKLDICAEKDGIVIKSGMIHRMLIYGQDSFVVHTYLVLYMFVNNFNC